MSKIGKRIKAARTQIEADKIYEPTEALELAKKTATTKFTGSIEVHFNLGINPKQTEQSVRGQVTMPHSTGKTVRVAAFVSEAKEGEAQKAGADVIGNEQVINEIRQTGRTDFDVAVASPDMMPKLATIAKILGPRGLMPNPRSGTVTPNIAEAIAEIKAGRMDFKNDDTGNVHGILGKSDMSLQQLVDNYKAFKEAVDHARPATVKKEYLKSISVNATMGPGIKVSL